MNPVISDEDIMFEVQKNKIVGTRLKATRTPEKTPNSEHEEVIGLGIKTPCGAIWASFWADPSYPGILTIYIPDTWDVNDPDRVPVDITLSELVEQGSLGHVLTAHIFDNPNNIDADPRATLPFNIVEPPFQYVNTPTICSKCRKTIARSYMYDDDGDMVCPECKHTQKGDMAHDK